MSEHTAYSLAGMADCGSPDSPESPGARFLLSVQDAVNEALEYHPELLTDEDNGAGSDIVSEIADGAPDIYTHTLWSEFVDLQAYQEDASELGGDAGDLEQCARIALYIIAERLAVALIEEARENAADEVEDDDTQGSEKPAGWTDRA